MQGQFYPKVFSKAEIALVIPKLDDQAYIHDKYMNELVKGIVSPATRTKLLAIVDRLRAQDRDDKNRDDKDRIDGLILGGTELTLILGDATDFGIPFLDTTRIHAEAARRNECGLDESPADSKIYICILQSKKPG